MIDKLRSNNYLAPAPAPASFRRLRTFPSASVIIFSSAVSPPLPRTRDRVALRERTTISTESILKGDRGLRPRDPGDESGGEAAVAAAAGVAGAGVEGALAVETGLRVGDGVLRGFVAGRRLREANAAGAGEDADADAGVPTTADVEAGGALTLPALLLSASLSLAPRGALMRTRALAGVSVVAAADALDFLATALVLRGPLAFCPIAPTPRAISAIPLSSVYLEALPSSSSSSSSLSVRSPGGGRARLTRPPPVLEPALGPGPGSRARMLRQLSRKHETSMSSAGVESERKRARFTSV